MVRAKRRWVVTLLGILLVGCDAGRAAPASDGAGDYWCIVGPADQHYVGSCTAREQSCSDRARLANDPRLRCERTHAQIYELRFTGQYGEMEAWFIDRATCEREARTFWHTNAPCSSVRWDESGRFAH